MKIKKWFLFSFVILALTFGVFGFTSMSNVKTAKAETYRTSKFLTKGTTSVDGATPTSGCPDNFKVYMCGAYTDDKTSEIYRSAIIDWTYYKITVEVKNVSNHIAFSMTRNGYTIYKKSLSGNGNITLYSDSLTDGEYAFEYTCNYKSGFLGLVTTNYSYKFGFEVDKTAPVNSLKAGGTSISSGSYTNKQVVYSASDKNFRKIRYYRPGVSSYTTSYSTSYTIPNTEACNGWWYFYATDILGASSDTVSVCYDTIAPVGKVTDSSGAVIKNGGYANKAISYTATDAQGVNSYQVKKPNSSTWTSYTAGTKLSGTGKYLFRSTDKAGNVSEEYSVYYDATSPTGTLYGGSSIKQDGDYTNAAYIKYVAADAQSGIDACYVKMPNSSYYTNYASGTQLATEGRYYFYSVDKSGNKSITASIVLDKTKPMGMVSTVGGTSIKSGSHTNTSWIAYNATEAFGVASSYVKKPGSSSFVAYTLNSQLSDEGEYTFYCIDKAGNRSENYTVTINRQMPTGEIRVDGKAFGGLYTNGENISFVCSAAKCYVMLPDSSTFTDYISGTEYYKPGRYNFYGKTEAGTVSYIYSITIDRTSKPLTIKNVTSGKTDGDVVIGWTDGDLSKFAPVKTVTVNGKPYAKGDVIFTIDTGKYLVESIDAAGNKWSTEFVSTKRNILTETLIKEYFETFDKNGEIYGLSTYSAAFEFAVRREKSFVRTGVWNGATWDTGIAMDLKDSVNAKNGEYFIYKKSGSENEEVAYFTEERLNEVIAEYAAVGINSFYYWEKEPATPAEGETIYILPETRNIIADKIDIGENVHCLANGEEFIDNVFDLEGEHVLTICDEWGNTCDYNVTVIRRAPDVLYAVNDGDTNTAELDRVYRFNDKLTVSIDDAYDLDAMFVVYDENENILGKLSFGETFELTDSGRYFVKTINRFGWSESFSVIISRNSPVVKADKNAEDKRLDISIGESEDNLGSIQSIEIYKSINGQETWVQLDKDDYGVIIEAGTYFFSFRTSGVYKIILTDEFRTGDAAVIEIVEYNQPTIDAILNGVENGGYTNGTVSVEWVDEVTVTATKDGETIDYNSGIELKDDGEYVIVFENFDGEKLVYKFVIDTIAPELTVSGTTRGSKSKDDVSVGFTENDLIVKLYKDGEIIDDYVSKTLITESGKYKVVATDKAGNVSEVEFEIDKIAPTLVISGVENGGQTSGGVTLSNLSEESTMTVKLNDETIEYEIGETLTQVGKYTVTVTDECGNESVYEFEIIKAKKPVNVGLIIAFVVSMMVAVGAATFLIIKKKREG